MNMNRIISILYLLLFFTGESELYAWTYPTSKPSYPFSSGDKIYHVNSDVEMKGLRCYFVAKESTTEPSEGGSSAFSNAKVIHSDGSSTDLRLIDSEGLRDRYIGSLFRVDEPVPDDSCIDLKKAGALNSAYLESIIIQ